MAHTAFRLPDGRTVQVSDDPAMWPVIGQTGFVPVDAVIPDPEQPRDTEGIESTDEHHEFAASVRQHGQGMIIQVTLLTDEELAIECKTHPIALYRIVDGERRSHAVGKKGADLAVIEITVVPPMEKQQQHLRQVVLNTMQEKLHGPDLVKALVRIKRDYNLTANRLASLVNMNQVLVNDMLHLEHLAPTLLVRTNRQTFQKRQHLATKPAVALSRIEAGDGKTAHERQVWVYEEAKRLKIAGAVQLVSFIEQYHSETVRKKSDRSRPSRRRNRLETLFELVNKSDLISIDEEGIKHLLSTATDTEVAALIGLAEKAERSIARLAELLRRHRRNIRVPHVQAPVVIRTPPIAQQVKQSAAPVPHRKSVVQPVLKPRVVAAPPQQPRSPVQMRSPPPRPQLPIHKNGSSDDQSLAQKTSKLSWMRAGMFHLDTFYYDTLANRMVMGTVDSLAKFERLWNGNLFKWQQLKEQKPYTFPTLEEVRTVLARHAR